VKGILFSPQILDLVAWHFGYVTKPHRKHLTTHAEIKNAGLSNSRDSHAEIKYISFSSS